MENKTLRSRLRKVPNDYEIFVCLEDEDLELPGMLVDHVNKQVILLPEGQVVNFDYVDFDQTEFFGHIEFSTGDEEEEEDGEGNDSDLDDDNPDVIDGECSEISSKGEESVG